MKKKSIVIISSIIIVYLLIFKFLKVGIPCIFHKITGLYCPGCGMTRMIVSIFSGNFYQAFRYNIVLFILFPFFIFYLINYIYSILKGKDPLYKKIPSKIIYILIIILILFGILRNIYPFLGPVQV